MTKLRLTGVDSNSLEPHAPRFQRAKERKVEKKAEAKEARQERLETDPAYAAAQARRHTPHDDPAVAAAKKRANEARRVGARAEFVCATRRGPTVVFDMSEEWELAMQVSERASLSQQLMCVGGREGGGERKRGPLLSLWLLLLLLLSF
jgi:hypothetical protein